MKPLKRVAPNAPHRPKIECINGNVLQHVRLRLKEASILRDLQQKWTAQLVTYTVRVTEQVTERVTEQVTGRVTERVTVHVMERPIYRSLIYIYFFRTRRNASWASKIRLSRVSTSTTGRNLMRVRQLVELNVFQPRNPGNVRLVFNKRPNDLFAAFRQPHACAYACNKVCSMTNTRILHTTIPAHLARTNLLTWAAVYLSFPPF